MLKEWEKSEKPSEGEIKARLEAVKEKLARQQLLIKEKKVPVLVVLEGWGTAGKGYAIGQIIQNIDPRFFKVVSMQKKTEDDKRKPFLYRHFAKIPEAGQFVFLDTAWMDEITEERLHGTISEDVYANRIESVRRFERQLTDNGYLVMKFFLHISKKEQSRRIAQLEHQKDTTWRVSKKDLWQNEHYEKCMDVFSGYLKNTNMPSAPWYIIDAKSRKWTEVQILETLTQGIEIALSNHQMAVPLLQNVFPLKKMPLLCDIPLDKCMEEDVYKKELKQLQQRLGELHNRLYRKKVPVIIAYEGWDAAGKGGNIKRIAAALDPRGYEVHPIAAPEPSELARHYLWRFWSRLEKNGHFTIFDRTWYGRVMVEPIEKLTPEERVNMAYREINEFESQLHDWGAEIIKFWVNVDKDEQLRRFNERENTPEKRWKITDEDWRNREKWPAYEKAVDEMLRRTHRDGAPWIVVEAENKKFARLKVLQSVIDAIEEALP